jgi:hypothetical protein
MTTESATADPYDTVIADLQAKRDHLDSMINALTIFRSSVGGLSMPPAQGAPGNEATPPAENVAGMFLGMSIVDAAKKLLAAQKKAMTNAEILAALRAGGVVLTGADPLNVVGSVLTRRFGQVGDVVRVARGTWGLKEWYPNRTFKPTPKATDAAIVPTTEQENSYTFQINDLGGSSEPESDF